MTENILRSENIRNLNRTMARTNGGQSKSPYYQLLIQNRGQLAIHSKKGHLQIIEKGSYKACCKEYRERKQKMATKEQEIQAEVPSMRIWKLMMPRKLMKMMIAQAPSMRIFS